MTDQATTATPALPDPFDIFGAQPTITPAGLVEGPGGPRDDEVPAILPLGAAVLNYAVTQIIGADRLQLLTAAVASRTAPCWLSAGEFVLEPNVASFLGREFIQTLNDVGNDFHDGLLETDHPDVLRAREIIEVLILRVLADAPENLVLPRREPALAGGGMLGIAMGAGVDEWGRQRTLDRLDKGEKRADEELGMRKATHAQTVALHGLQIKQAETKMTQQEEADKLLKEIQGGYKQILGGDYTPITEGIDGHYNKQAGPFNDGMTMAYQTDAGGNLVVNQLGKDGSQVTSKTLDRQAAANLYLQGKAALMKFNSPELFQAALTAEAAAREKAAERASKEKIATGSNQTTLKAAELTQSGSDRRHAETLDVQRGELGIKREKLDLDKERGGLTQQQLRQNAEIDAAHEAITGMDAAEIRRRTAKTTDTGRENRDFDPALERAARLASRRKIGRDDSFDSRQGQQKPVSGDPAQRFAADAKMKGYKLGPVDPKKGLPQVLDQRGKVVGYYE